MKRVLSLVLALVMVLGMIPMGFAADQTAGEVLKGYGLVAGYPDGSLGENLKINRAEMMVQLARLNGKFEEAKTFNPALTTFTDLEGFAWAAPYIAYAEINEWTAGVGANKFNPAGEVTLQEAAVFMLKSLGYVADTDFNWTNAVEVATAKGLVAGVSATGTAAVTRGELFTVMLNTLNTNLKDGSKTLLAKLGFVKQGIKEAKVTGAKVFQISFNEPVDTTKVAFAVKTGFVVYAPVVTWSADKTVATLTNAFNYAAGEYTITVTGVEEVKDAVKLTVVAPKDSAVVIKSAQLQKSAASVLKVELVNQYGEKITDAATAFTVTAYNTTKMMGVAVSVSGTDIVLNLTDSAIGDNIRVTAIHNTSALTAQTVLPVTAVAAANSIQFGAIELPSTVSRLVKTGTFKVAITAADQFANVIKFSARAANVDTVANVEKIGTISFYSSDNTVVSIDKMTVDADGKLNFVAENKAGTVIITAISDSGTTAQFTVQVFDTAAVKTFEIASPSTIVVANEAVVVPYMATNTYGEQVAQKDFGAAYQAGVDFVKSHSAGGTVNVTWGSANQLQVTSNMAGTIVVTPVVDGKFSQSLTLTVNPAAVPTVFNGVKDKVTKFLDAGTTTIKATDLMVKDQYGRDFDFASSTYTLSLAVGVGTDLVANVSTSGASIPVSGNTGVTLTGLTAIGTDEITISINHTSWTTPLEYKYNVATISTDDVKSYAINEIKTLYAKSDLTSGSDHAVTVVTVGKTAAGESVAIPASYFTAVTSSDLNVVAVDSAARKIWGLKEGTVTIAVFNGGTKLAERTVTTSTVTPYPVSAAFADESYVVATTLDLTTKLTVKDQYGVVMSPVGVWTSSAPAKVTVSVAGVVTRVATGEVTISFVTNNGLVAQVVIK